MSTYASVFCGLVLVATLVWWYFRRNFTYWQRQGILTLPPTFPFGNIHGVAVKRHIVNIVHDLYKQLAGRDVVAGVYFFTQPVLMILDPDLVKRILIKDFQYFHDRGVYMNEKGDPLSAHLFALEGTLWRNTRAKLSPTFTSGKMKVMFDTILAVGDKLHEFMEKNVDANGGGNNLEMKDIFARFTTDIIGNVAFGIECNSLNDPDVEFRKMASKILYPSKLKALKQMFMNSFKQISTVLRLKLFDPSASEFFLGMVRDTVEYREHNNVKRKDFMNLLLELRRQMPGNKESDVTFTFEQIAAQAFVFFLAGFETASLTLSFTAYEFALNPDVQTRARNEIREIIQKHNGTITYECVMQMRYLDQVINETLRKYPAVDSLMRCAGADYKIPDTDYTIRKGTQVIVPVYGFHHDARYFPDPEKYDPDRFTDEAIAARHPFVHLPFGDGPRVCIGMRFAIVQVKIGLIKMLLDYEFGVCDRTTIPMQFEPTPPIISPLGGCWLKVEKLLK